MNSYFINIYSKLHNSQLSICYHLVQLKLLQLRKELSLTVCTYFSLCGTSSEADI